MAITFLEPGGDADFAVNIISSNGFWTSKSGTPDVTTDFVHGNHIKSIKYTPTLVQSVSAPSINTNNTPGRISFYCYLNALPNANATIFRLNRVGFGIIFQLRLTSTGVMQIANDSGTQIGNNGNTLSTGVWYRICIAFNILSVSVNRIEVFVDTISSISITNNTLSFVGIGTVDFGNISGNTTLDMRTSDHYIDTNGSLQDTGDIWVTAKRPFSNGTTNEFTTQIGAGGSGYGSGHAPQVNERPLSTTNGWSMVGTGSAATEEYNIEGLSVGDFNLNGATIIDYLGWVSVSSLVGETIQIIVNGVNNSQAITSTNTVYTKIANSKTYPSGTGADIGITTDTTLTTVSLFECGIIMAFNPNISRFDFI